MTHEHHHSGCGCADHHSVQPAQTNGSQPVDLETAVAGAFALLEIGAKGGGISMSASGGELKLVKPIMPSLEFSNMLRAAKYERPAEQRPTFNLHILVEEENGEFECSVHQVLGVAPHASMEDPTKVLFSFKVPSAGEASKQLCEQLKVVIGETKLNVTQLFYRSATFTNHSFGRGDQPGKKLSYSKRLGGNADHELRNVVSDTVTKALAWGAGQSKAKYISLWFYPDGGEKPVYANIYPKGDQFKIVINDQVQVPPKMNIVDKLCPNGKDVADTLSRYMSRQYALKFKSLVASFFHEQELKAS